MTDEADQWDIYILIQQGKRTFGFGIQFWWLGVAAIVLIILVLVWLAG